LQSLNGIVAGYNNLMVAADGTALYGSVRIGAITYVDNSVLLAAPWQLVGFMWDTAKVYTIVNGVISAGTAAVGVLGSGTTAWSMGWQVDNTRETNGLIALPLVIPSAMTATWIINWYNLTRPS